MSKILISFALLLFVGQNICPPDDPITFDFECGCLEGWTIKGAAFAVQPTLNDNPTARNRGQPSQHEGAYWIGSYEYYTSYRGRPGGRAGDGPRGTMESNPFKIYSDRISFLIGGGCGKEERLELVVDGQVVRSATGNCDESMVRKSWVVRDLKGKHARIRAVDESSGGWGHLNFDDIKFTYY